MVQARQKYLQIHTQHDLGTFSFTTGFKYTKESIIYRTLQRGGSQVQKFKRKRDYNHTTSYSSAFTQPVRPVNLIGQTGLAWTKTLTTGQTGTLTGQTGRRKNWADSHSAIKCAIPGLPSLWVSLHHLPPLYIPADELDTAGAEVNVRVSWNICGNKPWATNTQQDLSD